VERLLEKSLDDQYAIERERKAVEDVLNKRLIWAFMPLGIAMAVAALYLDISTRIAIPVLVELQETVTVPGQRAAYDVFSLNAGAFARIVPAALIAGALSSWLAVWAGTYYRRDFIVPMYVLIAVAYGAVVTALLGLLIPLNMLVIDLMGAPITDAEIPRSSELSLFGRDLTAISPFSYVITGMERAMWAAAGFVVIALAGVRLSGGLDSAKGMIRSVVINTVFAVIVFGLLHSGSLGIHQYLFDRFVQPPSKSILGYQAEGNSGLPGRTPLDSE